MCHFSIVIVVFLVMIIPCAHAGDNNNKLRQKNRLNMVIRPLFPKRLQHAYKHSLLKHDRNRSDVILNYPLVDVWQYQYRSTGGKIITSDKPIATRKKYWKHPEEARIISVTLYGDNKIYLNGLLDFINSIDIVNDVNNKDGQWGFKSFTFRIYVAKRNKKRFNELGEIINATDQRFIDELLDQGCEIAYVDNGREVVGKDATFWRFMIAGEQMPEGQRIRYLVRDADWWLTGAELFTVLEWIESGLSYHRMHLFSLCIGPLTASIWGGTHTGKGLLSDIKNRMEYYPYRSIYGDDEMFTRDIIWPTIKSSGSVLTHIGKRGMRSWLSSPYKDSCEEPTQKFCDEMITGGNCIDRKIPSSLKFPQVKLGMRWRLKDVSTRAEYFLIDGPEERIVRAKQVY